MSERKSDEQELSDHILQLVRLSIKTVMETVSPEDVRNLAEFRALILAHVRGSDLLGTETLPPILTDETLAECIASYTRPLEEFFPDRTIGENQK